MDTIDLPSESNTVPTWTGVTSYIVNGMQPVFVRLPDGRWVNTAGIHCIVKAGRGLEINVGNECVSIPNAARFWGTQTTTPGL